MNSNAWQAFTTDSPDQYLRTAESREQRARIKVVSILREAYDLISADGVLGERALRVLEFGSGNGERLDLVLKSGVKVDWTGIDISSVLTSSAARRHPDQNWIVGDAEYPELVFNESTPGTYDICLFCHVLEIVGSPELALRKAKLLGKITVIEFFEPPVGNVHQSEIRFFPESGAPYLRHKIGKETYLTWLANAGFENLTVHQTFGKYEVHVLS